MLRLTSMTSTSDRAETSTSAEEKESSINPNSSRPSGSEKSTHELSPTYVVVTEPLASSMSVDHVPSLRVRSEELQRSVSSPQVCHSYVHNKN